MTPGASRVGHSQNRDLLGDEASGLAALPRVGSFHEEKLGLVEDVHQHRQLGVDQWLQTLLQSVDDVLQRSRPSGASGFDSF